MASGYQNIESQHQAAPVYAPQQGATPYADQESLYTGPTSYGSPSNSETNVPERPAWASLGGAVIIYDCVVLFLSFISAFITLVKLGSTVATLHTKIGTASIGVNPVNIGFIGGFLAFVNLFLPAILILAEIHFPLVVSKFPLATNPIVKAAFYFFFTFINFGFAGEFGLAVGAFMLIAAVLNGVLAFMNRN